MTDRHENIEVYQGDRLVIDIAVTGIDVLTDLVGARWVLGPADGPLAVRDLDDSTIEPLDAGTLRLALLEPVTAALPPGSHPHAAAAWGPQGKHTIMTGRVIVRRQAVPDPD